MIQKQPAMSWVTTLQNFIWRKEKKYLKIIQKDKVQGYVLYRVKELQSHDNQI